MDYIDKVLIVLSAESGGVSIISFKRFVRTLVEILGASFTLFFSLLTGIVKNWLSTQALIDMEISYEEFIMIFEGKK